MTARSRALLALGSLHGTMLASMFVLGTICTPRVILVVMQPSNKLSSPTWDDYPAPKVASANKPREIVTNWDDIPEIVGGLRIPQQPAPKHHEVEGAGFLALDKGVPPTCEVGPCGGCAGPVTKVTPFVPPRLGRVEQVTRTHAWIAVEATYIQQNGLTVATVAQMVVEFSKADFKFANGKAIPAQRLTAYVRPGAIIAMVTSDEALDPDVKAWLRDDSVILRLRGCGECGNGNREVAGPQLK